MCVRVSVCVFLSVYVRMHTDVYIDFRLHTEYIQSNTISLISPQPYKKGDKYTEIQFPLTFNNEYSDELGYFSKYLVSFICFILQVR